MWLPSTLTYIFKVIRPWLRKSCPLCSVYSSGWIRFIFGTNDCNHKRMCCVLRFFQNLEKWIFGKILKFFGLDLDKKSIVRDGFFPCLAQMITGMRGCVAYNDLWPWPIPSRSTMGHLFYATSSFVHYFVATGEFKLELQSGNAQSGSNSTIFGAVWPWNVTDDLETQ